MLGSGSGLSWWSSWLYFPEGFRIWCTFIILSRKAWLFPNSSMCSEKTKSGDKKLQTLFSGGGNRPQARKLIIVWWQFCAAVPSEKERFLHLFGAIVTLKCGQDHSKWYASVKLRKHHHSANFVTLMVSNQVVVMLKVLLRSDGSPARRPSNSYHIDSHLSVLSQGRNFPMGNLGCFSAENQRRQKILFYDIQMYDVFFQNNYYLCEQWTNSVPYFVLSATIVYH